MMNYNKRTTLLLISAFIVVMLTIQLVSAVSEVPFAVEYDFEDIGLFTISNFRQQFTSDTVVLETNGKRCISIPQEQEIAVNFRKSRPPSSSLQTISAPIGDNNEDFLLGSACEISYRAKAKGNPTYTSYSTSDIKPCVGLINGVLNPKCPALYYPSADYLTIRETGKVVYDADIKQYQCRDNSPITPYLCYSDKCGGNNLIIKDMNACVFNSEFGSQSERESNEPTESTNTGFLYKLNDIILKVVAWFKNLI